ncbi:MAG: hypothetical protein KatS3mg124_0304 [Porticoccaceae bacterium]|nr:MAG: hypothetical protein KatS3mg124_0304 [Porticoccaceae bacterium]
MVDAAHFWASLQRWLGEELLLVGDYALNTYQLVTAAAILLATAVVVRLARRALARLLAFRGNVREAQIYTLTRLLGYGIYLLGALAALSALGITFDRIALVAGALSVGIGFGLQNVVSNFVSGIIILFERSLRVGDFVELESGLFGEVAEIRIRSTLIRTLDNEDILVPNTEFITGRVTNWTLRDDYKRIKVEFGVAYGTDPDLVIERVAEAARCHPDVVSGAGREPMVLFAAFGDSSLDFELVVWIRGELVRRPGVARSRFLLLIHRVLAENAIEVPFPQRDIHIRSGLEALAKKVPDPIGHGAQTG